MTALDFATTSDEIRSGAAARVLERDLLIATGPDAAGFLQGQLSQDLAGLTPGGCVESLVLSPRGKLDAYVRVLADDNAFLLEVAAGSGEALLERLARFRVRVRVELSLESCPMLALRGPRAGELAGRVRVPALALPYRWPPVTGVDLLCRETGRAELEELAAPLGDEGAFECWRIRCGEPVAGSELTEQTIAQETLLTPRTVSFTKGCFTGQELLARLDARGANVARHLRGLRVSPGERHRLAYAGEPVVVDGETVGRLSSVAWSPVDGCTYALAYVGRRVVPPAAATVLAAGGEDMLDAEIVELPFV